MLKKTIMLAAACALAFCMSTGVSSAKNMGPEEMVLKTAKAKKPAKFNHKKHQGAMECAECHHTKNADGTKGPYVEGQEAKCESCHNADMTNEKLNDFKNAAHANCKDCHKEKAKGGNANAPTKCNGCHVTE